MAQYQLLLLWSE